MRAFSTYLQRYLLHTIISVILAGLICACTVSGPIETYIDHAPESLVLTSVDYELDERGRIIVPVLVNGQGPYSFVLDTASSRTLIYENVRRALGLEFIDDRTTFVHGATLSQRRPIIPVNEFRIGPLVMSGASSFSLPDPISIDKLPGGVLGMDFLRNYALFLSVEENRVHFAQSGFQGKLSEYSVAPIEYDDFGILDIGLPIIPVTVAEFDFDALFDLGSEATVANWPAAEKFALAVRRTVLNKYEFEGALSEFPIDGRMDDASIIIGKREWSGQRIEVSNLPIFRTINRADKPAMIVSAALLRDENMVIDFPAAQLWLRTHKDQRVRRGPRGCNIVPGETVALRCDSTRLN